MPTGPTSPTRAAVRETVSRVCEVISKFVRRFGHWLTTAFLLALPVVAAARANRLFADGCSPSQPFEALTQPIPLAKRACAALPLSVDVPSLALGISSAMAVGLYGEASRRLASLNHDLTKTGLVQSKKPIIDFGPRLLRATLGRTLFALTLGTLSLVGWRFYHRTRSNDPFFAYASHRTSIFSEKDAPALWWANDDHSVLAAFAWVAVGVIGAAAALMHARLNSLLAARLHYLRDEYEVEWVAARRSSNGWAPFGPILIVSLIGIANFAVAFGSIAYLLNQINSSTLSVTTTLIVFIVGLVANGFLMASILSFILRRHAATIAREIGKKQAEQKRAQRRRPRTEVAAMVRDADLKRLESELKELDGAPIFPLSATYSRRLLLLVSAGGGLPTLGLLVGLIIQIARS